MQYGAQANSSGEIISFLQWPESKLPAGYVAISATEYSALDAAGGMGWTLINGVLTPPAAPTAAQLLAAAQAAQGAVLAAACAAAIVSGFTSSALGGVYTYPSKPNDQSNLIGAEAASRNPANPSTWTIPFWCADSTGAWALRAHTAEQIQQVLTDGVTARVALSQKLAGLAAQVQAATTVSGVQAIVWS